MTELETAALAAIIAIIQQVEAAKSGTVDPGAALAAIGTLQQALAANSEAADKALADRFDKTDTKPG